MEDVKTIFRRVGINLNDVQIEAVKSLISSGGNSSNTEITEITKNNVFEAVKYTNNVVINFGLDAQDNDGNMYALFYAIINGNKIPLPISAVPVFLYVGIPFHVTVDKYYNYREGYIAVVNTNEEIETNGLTISNYTFYYSKTDFVSLLYFTIDEDSNDLVGEFNVKLTDVLNDSYNFKSTSKFSNGVVLESSDTIVA